MVGSFNERAGISGLRQAFASADRISVDYDVTGRIRDLAATTEQDTAPAAPAAEHEFGLS